MFNNIIEEFRKKLENIQNVVDENNAKLEEISKMVANVSVQVDDNNQKILANKKEMAKNQAILKDLFKFLKDFKKEFDEAHPKDLKVVERPFITKDEELFNEEQERVNVHMR